MAALLLAAAGAADLAGAAEAGPDAPPVLTPAPVAAPPIVQPTEPSRPAVPPGPAPASPIAPTPPLGGLSGGGDNPLVRLDVGDVGSGLSLDGRGQSMNSLAPGGLATPPAAAEPDVPPPASGFNPMSPTGLAVFAGSMLVLGVAAWFVGRRKA